MDKYVIKKRRLQSDVDYMKVIIYLFNLNNSPFLTRIVVGFCQVDGFAIFANSSWLS